MKDSEEISNLLSALSNRQEVKDICAQIEEFEHYMKENNVLTEKRRLIISQEEKFMLYHYK